MREIWREIWREKSLSVGDFNLLRGRHGLCGRYDRFEGVSRELRDDYMYQVCSCDIPGHIILATSQLVFELNYRL